MGRTIANLSNRKFPEKAIFNNRMVVEVAETFHIHYRNLRIALSQTDWEQFGKGMNDAWQRWIQRGKPECREGEHIELCRKEVAKSAIDRDFCKVNLNKNLYSLHEGKIFAEGADLLDDTYIHVKVRDIRLEFTKDEFKLFSEAIREASDAV